MKRNNKHLQRIFSVMLAAMLAAGTIMTDSASATVMAQGNYFTTIGDYRNVYAVIDSKLVLWMWGDNNAGQLGNGGKGDKLLEDLHLGETYAVQTAPTPVMENVFSVAVGENHTAALCWDGTLWAWGFNAQGQVGNGGAFNSSIGGYPVQNTPVKVMDGVAAVACGPQFTAAIKKDASLWMWGYTAGGALGGIVGDVSYPGYGVVGQSTPVKVMDDVTAVSCGSDCTAVIKSDSSLWMWGDNFYGQLGDGSAADSLKPEKIMDNVRTVSTGFNMTAAITYDNELWVWGNIGYGNASDGYVRYQNKPLKVMSGVSDVCCGNGCINVVRIDNTALRWKGGKSQQVLDFANYVCCNLAVKYDGTVWLRDSEYDAFYQIQGLNASFVQFMQDDSSSGDATGLTEDFTVVPTSQNLRVNGAKRDAEIYNIDGANYFKLRDVAMLLNGTGSQFSVNFDAAANTIVVETGKAYKPVGGELATGTDKSATTVKSSQSLRLDGELVDLTAYNIGGNNFFKLRDLGAWLNFDVDYDDATHTMLVTSR